MITLISNIMRNTRELFNLIRGEAFGWNAIKCLSDAVDDTETEVITQHVMQALDGI